MRKETAMTNTPENVPGPAPLLQRIDLARAARTAVDSQGRPAGQAARYDYDARGILTTATPASADSRGTTTGTTGDA